MTTLLKRYDEVINGKPMAHATLYEWFNTKADAFEWTVCYHYTDAYDDMYGDAHTFTDTDEWDFEDYFDAVRRFEQCKEWMKIYRLNW